MSAADSSTFADPLMLELFATELQTNLALLNEGLLALEQVPADSAALATLMRAAHSIKGAARIVGVGPAVTLAHRMEDLFVLAQKGGLALDSGHIDLLLGGCDLLGRIGEMARVEPGAQRSGLDAEVDALALRLEAVKSGGGAGPTLAPAAPAGAGAQGAAPAPAAAPAAPGSAPAPPPTAAAEPSAAPAPPQPAEPPAPARVAAEAVRVSAEHLNRLMDLTGEAVVKVRGLSDEARALVDIRRAQYALGDSLACLERRLAGVSDRRIAQALIDLRGRADQLQERLARHAAHLAPFAAGFEHLAERLYQETVNSRMRPFSDGVQGFPRMVRDLARQLGKRVRLEIAGEGTRVDRDILEKLEAPLTHILRNAVDHGLEDPAGREAAGKPEEGSIRLEAGHHAGMLSIRVADDGRGIPIEGLRAKVVGRGLIAADIAAHLTQEELLEFLFLPGFSTAAAVTEISGRGVGLDVVQSMVRAVGGSVRIATVPGSGTTLQLLLPVTLSVVRALLAEIEGEPYAFRLSQIERCLKLAPDAVRLAEDRQYVQMDGQNVALIDVRQVLGLPMERALPEELPAVVVGSQRARFGLIVNRLIGEHELVVHPLDARLGKVPGVAAAATRDDGAPVLVLDVDDIVQLVDAQVSGGRLGRAARLARDVAKARKHVLVVDDSITVREVERKLLENDGYDVDVAVDGMDAWNALCLREYDLVVSDIDMPRMDGIRLIEQIRRDRRLAELPVIVVSYKESEEDRHRGLDAGASAYLTKSSFQDESFIRTVRDLAGGSGT